MAEKPRIRLPKQAGKGEVVEIKTLIAHVMESGQRKDSSGKVVPRKIINRFACAFNRGSTGRRHQAGHRPATK